MNETAYVVWEVQTGAPRFGAGVFRTRAEAEAVANHSMARGPYRPGELVVKPLAYTRNAVTLH
jgi:hypothetical protein